MDDQITEMECIPVGTLQEQFTILQKRSMMQRTHNSLAKDFEILAAIAKENSNDSERIKPVIRACIKELFSLVEGDLYLINQYLPYEGYTDTDNLSKKFKKTYRHHSKRFKKEEIKTLYQRKSYGRLYRLKQKRDDIMHPKGLKAIDVVATDLNEVIDVYQEYRNLCQSINE